MADLMFDSALAEIRAWALRPEITVPPDWYVFALLREVDRLREITARCDATNLETLAHLRKAEAEVNRLREENARLEQEQADLRADNAQLQETRRRQVSAAVDLIIGDENG